MPAYAYSLTGLTGRKKNVDRSVIVATVEVNRFTFAVVVSAAIVSLLPTVGVGLLLGPLWWLALGLPFLFVAAGLIFIDQRSKGGLRLRRYQAIAEKRRGKKRAEAIYVCGVPLSPPVMRSIVPQFRDAAPASEPHANGTDVRVRGGKGSILDA